MIGIQPGYEASTVLGYLNAAAVGARNIVSGRDSGSLIAYADWTATHLRTLGPALKPDDLDALITTKKHWTLLSLLPYSNSAPVLPELVNLELTQRAAALEVAHQLLEIELMMSRNLDAAVLDTNVLMVLGEQLETYDWYEKLEIRPLEPLVIWIPLAVIDELDRKKLDRNTMTLSSKKVSRRTLARVALREIDRMFPEPGLGYVVDRGTLPLRQRFEIRILMEEPGHVRLDSVDAEVVDQAANLTAMGGRVQVVTFDTGMRLKARAAGVLARQLPEPEDD